VNYLISIGFHFNHFAVFPEWRQNGCAFIDFLRVFRYFAQPMRKCRFVILILLCTTMNLPAQEREMNNPDKTRSSRSSLVRENLRLEEIINKAEEGIQSGNVKIFGDELGTVVSISIGSVENSSLSTNHTISVLTDYFATRKAISFRFSLIDLKRPTPYATGRYVCIQKGNKESAQIYISLTMQDSRWVISQFNIY
jgi:hypothetical protein